MPFCLCPWSATLPSPLPFFPPEQIGFLGMCDLCFMCDVGVRVSVCRVRGGGFVQPMLSGRNMQKLHLFGSSTPRSACALFSSHFPFLLDLGTRSAFSSSLCSSAPRHPGRCSREHLGCLSSSVCFFFFLIMYVMVLILEK